MALPDSAGISASSRLFGVVIRYFFHDHVAGCRLLSAVDLVIFSCHAITPFFVIY